MTKYPCALCCTMVNQLPPSVQVATYCMVQNGSFNASHCIDDTGVSRRTVYDVLGKLVEAGAVVKIENEGRANSYRQDSQVGIDDVFGESESDDTAEDEEDAEDPSDGSDKLDGIQSEETVEVGSTGLEFARRIGEGEVVDTTDHTVEYEYTDGSEKMVKLSVASGYPEVRVNEPESNDFETHEYDSMAWAMRRLYSELGVDTDGLSFDV